MYNTNTIIYYLAKIFFKKYYLTITCKNQFLTMPMFKIIACSKPVGGKGNELLC